MTLEFMGIENIHEIRKSFNSLQVLVRNRFTVESWLTSLESTNWLSHIRTILKASVYIAKLLSVCIFETPISLSLSLFLSPSNVHSHALLPSHAREDFLLWCIAAMDGIEQRNWCP
jgi:hypothetical protein